jgi:transcriptional regulator with XRE-family HTH domain
MDNENKGQWLDDLLDVLGWTPADLSRASGLDSAVISNIRNGKRGVGTSTAAKIGKATKRPTEEILRLAGEIDTKPPTNPIVDQITYLTSDLPQNEQLDILEFVKLRHRLAEERGTYEPKRKKSSSTNH